MRKERWRRPSRRSLKALRIFSCHPQIDKERRPRSKSRLLPNFPLSLAFPSFREALNRPLRGRFQNVGGLGTEPAVAAIRGRVSARRLPTQTQAVTIRAMNVCFRQKPPGGFRDRAPTPLMTATGWFSANHIRASRRQLCALIPVIRRRDPDGINTGVSSFMHQSTEDGRRQLLPILPNRHIHDASGERGSVSCSGQQATAFFGGAK